MAFPQLGAPGWSTGAPACSSPRPRAGELRPDGVAHRFLSCLLCPRRRPSWRRRTGTSSISPAVAIGAEVASITCFGVPRTIAPPIPRQRDAIAGGLLTPYAIVPRARAATSNRCECRALVLRPPRATQRSLRHERTQTVPLTIATLAPLSHSRRLRVNRCSRRSHSVVAIQVRPGSDRSEHPSSVRDAGTMVLRKKACCCGVNLHTSYHRVFVDHQPDGI